MIALNVAQLLKHPVGATRQWGFEESDPELEQTAAVRGPVSGQAHLLRTKRGILATVDYTATVELSCGRCLEPLLATVSGTIEEEFLPALDIQTDEPLSGDGDQPHIGADHVLDLTDVTRQDILVRAPLRPLCESNCAGLCPECGAVRKRQMCACRPVTDASPFQALAKLLEPDRVE